jgi:hypothetical protein
MVCSTFSLGSYIIVGGCLDCYALIQHRKNEINSSLSRYREQIDDIQNNPMPVDDAEFDDRVNIVRKDVAALHDKARLKMGGYSSGIKHLDQNSHNLVGCRR